MKTFKDEAGRTWTLAVNVSAIKRVRDLIDVDLMQLVEGEAKLIERLYTDPILLVDVLYAICKPQADKESVTDEQFGEAMAGDAIELATTALLDDIISFFPSSRSRERITKVMAKFRAVIEKVHDKLDVAVDSPALERKLEEVLETVGEPFGDLPESSESTPAP